MSDTDGGGSGTPYHSSNEHLTHAALSSDSRFQARLQA